MNIGKAIKLCRTRRGLSQTELAALAELSISYLSLLERNKRDPTFGTVGQIAQALDVPMFILITLASSEAELACYEQDVREKLALATLQLTGYPE